MKSCPFGAAIPAWQPCELGRASRGNTSIQVLEVATASLATQEGQGRLLREIGWGVGGKKLGP
ncbi:PRY3 [Symbiodinium sp. CCMP2592]|nr:PRY3 [Symbiodinium sp. CCMP2592]